MDPKALLDSLDVGVAVLARDWTVEDWSAGAARVTGLAPDRVVGQSFWTAFPTAKGTHLGDGAPQTFLFPARAGEAQGVIFDTRVSRSPRGQLILQFRQVREELNPESRAAQILMAFEAERRLYHQMFDTLPAPALVVVVDGSILEANPAAVALLAATDARALRARHAAHAAARRPARRGPEAAAGAAGDRGRRGPGGGGGGRHHQRRSRPQRRQAAVPGGGRVPRSAAAAQAAAVGPARAAGRAGLGRRARAEQPVGGDRGVRGAARRGRHDPAAARERPGDPRRSGAGRAHRAHAARLRAAATADAAADRSQGLRGAGGRPGAQRA